MHETIIHIYSFNLLYAQKLAADVPDEKMCAQPIDGKVMNHPAFLLGHLALVSDSAPGMLGQQPTAPAAWKELFGMGAKVQADRKLYPAKAELLKALEDAHGRFVAALTKATPEELAKPAPERMRARFPTIVHLLHGMMTSHEAVHLGQFSAWRRAMGFPSAF